MLYWHTWNKDRDR
ncbi:hypothetical protein BDFB_014267 [Asbolus verrucosus]|uniref:Uncharacterized protein n=1 Tax=Asbolus verrucosus TaxID=1661398 RepID=A0A482VRR2_ASBVE|nr:hypothetical protein BDFB_014267 [Asbolus verrucosus]